MPHTPLVIATTGATGRLGGRVARLLSQAGVSQVLPARDPSRLPAADQAEPRGPAGYADRAAMCSALRGADALFLVSGNLSGHRLEEHTTAIEAAREVGIDRVVYVSLLGAAPDATYVNARDHWQTEQYLAGSELRFTILRSGFYSSMLPDIAGEDRVIRGPADEGRVSAVAHEDIARVAVSVLLDATPQHDGQTYEVTGPEAVTLAEAAEQITSATGIGYAYRSESDPSVVTWRDRTDPTPEKVAGWASWYRAIAAGEAATVTDVVPHLTGHKALTIEQTLAGARPAGH